jgi:flavin reductase (DIM6/NTAB) family NADH-FMN oxidoreductase RutF
VEGLLGILVAEWVAEVTIDPADSDPRNVYKLMIGAIVPRPIAFVSSLSKDGVRNLAPFSFFTAVSANPPVVCFSPMIRGIDVSKKDTLRNIEATGEFVINVVSEDFAQAMNLCSGEYPPDIDEFALSKLTPIASEAVKPPRVAEARVQMECTLLEVVHISAKPLGGSLVLGKIVRFHVDDAIVNNFQIDPDKLNAVGRMGGAAYTRTSNRFDMRRPT